MGMVSAAFVSGATRAFYPGTKSVVLLRILLHARNPATACTCFTAYPRKAQEERIVQVKLLDGTIKQVEHYELTKASLGYLVNLLVSLDLSLRLME